MGFLSVSKMAGGRLFEGGDYFKYFGQRGAIIRGRRLIEGRLLFEEIRYTVLVATFILHHFNPRKVTGNSKWKGVSKVNI